MSDRNIGGQINVTANVSPAIQALDNLAQVMVNAEKVGDKATAALAAKAIANATKIAQANNKVSESEKQLTAITRAEAAERVRIADAAVAQARAITEKARTSTVRARGKADVALESTKSTNRLTEIEERESQKRRSIYAQRHNDELNTQNRIRVNSEMEMEKRYTAFYRDQLSTRRRMYEQDIRKNGPMSQQWQSVMNASIGRSNMMYGLYQTAAATGTTPSSQLFARINASAAASNAAYLQQLQAQQVAAAGGRGGRGGFGLFGRVLGMGGGGPAGAMLSSLAGGFGIGLGGYALARGVSGITENVDRATAYARQTVAARELAGSQQELNRLLEEYQKQSGGAVDKTVALENVSRLLATGYAESAEEVGRFVRATRGASLALGRPQDYVIQETQLAISNTSYRRLDQIGLGIKEVRDRMADLRRESHGMTRESAFQIAVLELMDEKYGALSNSVEGQRTGLERLRASWQDFGLSIGQALKEPVDAVTSYLEQRIKDIIKAIEFAQRQINESRRQRDEDREFFERHGRMPSISPDAGWDAGKRMYGVQSIAPRYSSSGSIGQPVTAPTTLPSERFEQEEEDAIVEWHRNRAAIERKANADILAVQREYSMQRAATIRQYEKTIAREAQDFAKQRARAEEDYQDSIVKLRRDSARAEQEAVEDLAKNIAKAWRDHEERLADMADDYHRQVAESQEDFNDSRAEQEEDFQERLDEAVKNGNERLLKSEKDFNKEREKAAAAHRETIENAAARFDARAIYEEQRRFMREREERLKEREEQKKEELEKLEETTADIIRQYEKRQSREEAQFEKAASRAQAAYDRQVAAENKNYQRQLDDMETAFQEQRSKAAEQEEQRLLDMAEAFQKRKAREDIDRAENLSRMATDHGEQLEEMERQKNARIAQIKEHAAEERQQLDDEFQERLGELGLQTDEWYDKQERLVQEAIDAFDEWFEHVKTQLNVIPGHPSLADPYVDRELPKAPVSKENQELLNRHKEYEDIITNSRPGSPESVRATTEQYKLEQQMKSLGIPIPDYSKISSVMASGVTSQISPVVSASSIGATSTSYGGATYVVQTGAVQIQASPGQDEEELGRIVEERLIKALERASVAFA